MRSEYASEFTPRLRLHWWNSASSLHALLAMDTSRLIAVVQSRWELEERAQHLAAAPGQRSLPVKERFIYRPLGEQLALVLAQDGGDYYEYVDADSQEWKTSGLDRAAALDIGWSNQLRVLLDGASDVQFEAMPEFGWIPSVAGTDECITLLAQTSSIRALPVSGRHVAFVPNTRGFWVTGSGYGSGIDLLCAIVCNEYENAEGKPVTRVPQILDEAGRWQPWLPSPDHPSYWEVRALHVHQADEIYERQWQRLSGGEGGPAGDAHVARLFAHKRGDQDLEVTFTSTVWGDVETLLPQADMVEIKPLLNRAAVEQQGAEPEFGKTIPIAWQKLREALGDLMQPQGMYPERYKVGRLPPEPLLSKLRQAQMSSPHELFPGMRSASTTAAAPLVSQPLPQSPGSSRVLLVLGMMATMVLLCAGCGVAALIGLWNTLPIGGGAPPMASGALPGGIPIPPPQRQAASDALATINESLGQMRNLLPLPDLAAPEESLPLLPLKHASPVAATGEDDRDSNFRNQAPSGGWLVGMRVVTGDDWGGVLRSLQPIYQVEDKYSLATRVGSPGGMRQVQLLAKPGYAVSGIETERGLVVNCLRLTYSRVCETHFDPADSYQSEWVGVEDGREIHTLSGRGFPLVGLAGRYENGCFGTLSLLQGIPASDAPENRVVEATWTPIADFPELAEPEWPLPPLSVSERTVARSLKGSLGPNELRDDAPEGAWLVGFRVTTGNDFAGVVRSIQPIYQHDETYVAGETLGAFGGLKQTEILARAGYAVSAVELQRGLVVNCLRVTFARVFDQHLDPTDSYQSSWLGYSDGRQVETISGDGRPIVGLVGSASGDCIDDLQLIRATVAKEQR